MTRVEVERRYQVHDPAVVRERIAAQGAVHLRTISQVDEYYNHPSRDFLAPRSISEWLRLRIDDTGTYVVYKSWHPRGAVVKTHADEHELAVGGAEQARSLLRALGFAPILEVVKIREEWGVSGIRVALDHVVGAGDFVEFESDDQGASVTERLAFIDAFVAALGLDQGEPLNRGYPQMLLGRD